MLWNHEDDIVYRHDNDGQNSGWPADWGRAILHRGARMDCFSSAAANRHPQHADGPPALPARPGNAPLNNVARPPAFELERACIGASDRPAGAKRSA